MHHGRDGLSQAAYPSPSLDAPLICMEQKQPQEQKVYIEERFEWFAASIMIALALTIS
jgi:hypothetical protein